MMFWLLLATQAEVPSVKASTPYITPNMKPPSASMKRRFGSIAEVRTDGLRIIVSR